MCTLRLRWVLKDWVSTKMQPRPSNTEKACQLMSFHLIVFAAVPIPLFKPLRVLLRKTKLAAPTEGQQGRPVCYIGCSPCKLSPRFSICSQRSRIQKGNNWVASEAVMMTLAVCSSWPDVVHVVRIQARMHAQDEPRNGFEHLAHNSPRKLTARARHKMHATQSSQRVGFFRMPLHSLAL